MNRVDELICWIEARAYHAVAGGVWGDGCDKTRNLYEEYLALIQNDSEIDKRVMCSTVILMTAIRHDEYRMEPEEKEKVSALWQYLYDCAEAWMPEEVSREFHHDVEWIEDVVEPLLTKDTSRKDEVMYWLAADACKFRKGGIGEDENLMEIQTWFEEYFILIDEDDKIDKRMMCSTIMIIETLNHANFYGISELLMFLINSIEEWMPQELIDIYEDKVDFDWIYDDPVSQYLIDHGNPGIKK